MIRSAILLLCVLTFVARPAEGAGALCGRHETIVQRLAERYGEVRAAIGLAGDRRLVEVYVSALGTFSILVTTPDGRACLLAAGEGWERLPVRPAAKQEGAAL